MVFFSLVFFLLPFRYLYVPFLTQESSHKSLHIQELIHFNKISFTLQDGIVLYIRDRNSIMARQHYTEMCHAVDDSRKLIILLSNSYLTSNLCLNEANLLAGKRSYY